MGTCGDWRGGGWGEREVSKMWEVNPAVEPLTGMPAVRKGSSVHRASRLPLKICSVGWELLPSSFRRPGVTAGPHGERNARKECAQK